MRAWALPDRLRLGAGLGGDREAQEDAGSPSAPGARELLGGGGAEGGGEKAPPAARGRDPPRRGDAGRGGGGAGPGGGAERSGPFASPIRRMGIAGDVGTLAGLLLVHESY